ncbi:MAG TPA: tetratricopeptide repeat protein [Polyangiaceae bacterium]|nr:tetratricopeptide repeat protein [Polyangiaceae bacterium]
MKREREAADASGTPEGFLQRAIAARSAAARARWARQGLASRSPLDRTTQSMLLRQLYLACFEQRDFERAQEIAEQMVELGVLPDVCHHDLARAMAALDDIDGAAGQLRLAARTAPASRRGFHLWTLGSLLFLAERYPAAHAALLRALRWSTSDRPLVLGHLALVLIALGQPPADLATTIEQLAEAPCGQGYGRFVLGLLCHRAGRRKDAERHLRAFVTRTRASRPALAISLSGELMMAERHLAELDVN